MLANIHKYVCNNEKHVYELCELFILFLKNTNHKYALPFISILSKCLMHIILICKEDKQLRQKEEKHLKMVFNALKDCNMNSKDTDSLITSACEFLQKKF